MEIVNGQRTYEFSLLPEHFEAILNEKRRAFLSASLGVLRGDVLRFREVPDGSQFAAPTDRQFFARVTHTGATKPAGHQFVKEYWFTIIATENCAVGAP